LQWKTALKRGFLKKKHHKPGGKRERANPGGKKTCLFKGNTWGTKNNIGGKAYTKLDKKVFLVIRYAQGRKGGLGTPRRIGGSGFVGGGVNNPEKVECLKRGQFLG